MEKKMEIFKLYSEAFRGAYFWRMGEKFVQNSFSNFKALFMYADLKNPFDPAPRGQITPATKDTFLHDEWVHNFPLLI